MDTPARSATGGNASDIPRPRPGWARGTKVALAGAGAALAAGAAYLNWRRAAQIDDDNPPAGRFIEVDGVRLHYVERGEGRAVVLLHGNGVTLEDMEASGLIDAAAEKYRVIAFDRPGFGHSSRPRSTVWTPEAQAALLMKAFRSLGIDRPVVAGHSWGTLVTLALALDFPDEIAAAVLLSGYYFGSFRVDGALLAGPAIPVLGDVMRYTVSPPLAKLLMPGIVRRTFAPANVSESFARYPIEMSLRPSQLRASSAEAAMMVPAAIRLSRRYPELALPVVIVTGDGDKIAKFDEQSVALHEAVEGSTLHVVPGAGHMIHHLAPGVVLAAIDEAAATSAVIGGAAGG